MNDELPFAVGFPPSLTHWVIGGPYSGMKLGAVISGAHLFAWGIAITSLAAIEALVWFAGAPLV